MAKRTASIWFDRVSDPTCPQWAWDLTRDPDEGPEESGGLDTALDEEAPLQRLLDVVRADQSVPAALREMAAQPDLWRPVQHDGPGWEVRA